MNAGSPGALTGVCCGPVSGQVGPDGSGVWEQSTPWARCPHHWRGLANLAEFSASLSHSCCKTFCDTLYEGHCINNKLHCIIYQTSSDHRKKHNKPLTTKVTNSPLCPRGRSGQRLCMWRCGPHVCGAKLLLCILGICQFEQSKGAEPLQTPGSDSASFPAAVSSSWGHLPQTGPI